jgi:hypothetical protein
LIISGATLSGAASQTVEAKVSDLPEAQTDDADVLMLARALDRAIKAAPNSGLDTEQLRAILMTGITDAVGRGVHDETILTDSALAALALYLNDSGRSYGGPN